jgi:hypothetical protein
MLRDILYAFPSDLSETDCRRAFATLESCGGMCAEIGNYAGCEAEVAALDAACLESPPTCP